MTLMADEAAEIPQAAGRFLHADALARAEAGCRLRAFDPALVLTIARGSSGHAAAYLTYLVEIAAGVPALAVDDAARQAVEDTPSKLATQGARVFISGRAAGAADAATGRGAASLTGPHPGGGGLLHMAEALSRTPRHRSKVTHTR